MKYWTRHGIMGMMGKHGFFSDVLSYYHKNKSNIVSFDITLDHHNKTAYSYIPEAQFLQIPKKNIKSKYVLTQTVSHINAAFLRTEGKVLREFRETKNKFNKIITIQTEPNSIDEVVTLIDTWDAVRGPVYGWQRHSGYDRSFFLRFYEQEKGSLQCLFFYLDGALVGYSVISLVREDDAFVYMIRKNDTRHRNLCLYIDFKAFELLHKREGQSILVNWGASSGSLLRYKEKFPVASQEPMYFFRKVPHE